MEFANPLGLLALLAVPAVLALHLFRRRFQPREVSALFLWASRERAPRAGRQREPLRSNASLWLELACALALALAFSGPRSSCGGARGEHLVVVLDGSASMSARTAQGAVYERLAARVRERIEALPRGSRVTLVESARRARLLAGPAAPEAVARDALARWRPAAPRHELHDALAFARQFAGEGRVLVCSDHFEPQDWPAEVELIAAGAPLDNWAITKAARTPADGAAPLERALVTVASFAVQPRELTLIVSSEGREVARSPLRLEPGARASSALSLPASCGPITLAIDADALELDNVAWLAPAAVRRVALRAELDAATLATLGLSRGAQGDIERWLALVPRSQLALDVERAHLVLGAPRETSGPAWFLELAALGEERRDWLGPFLVDRTHAALEGLTLEGAVWSGDPTLELRGAPLVSIGERALLSEERLGARRVWRLNLDPQRSSLQRTPDWPILLANLAELRRAATSGVVRTNLAVGERLEYRSDGALPGAAGSYELDGPLDGLATGPARAQVALPLRAEFDYDGLDAPGWYHLSAGDRELATLGVSFMDGAESDLRRAGSGRREAQRASSALNEPLSWLELAALAGALALACADWWVLSRWRAGGEGSL